MSQNKKRTQGPKKSVKDPLMASWREAERELEKLCPLHRFAETDYKGKVSLEIAAERFLNDLEQTETTSIQQWRAKHKLIDRWKKTLLDKCGYTFKGKDYQALRLTQIPQL